VELIGWVAADDGWWHLSRQDEDWLTASEWLRPLLFSLLIIYLSELTVDWLKHTSIINFTDLSPHMYTELAYKISKRLLDVDDKSVRTTHTPTPTHQRPPRPTHSGRLQPALTVNVSRVPVPH
jgi:hypothetical protein